MSQASKKLLLVNPRGFCAGVERAIEIVHKLLQHFGAPVYVRHELVHNQRVVDELTKQGVIFVDEINQIPPNSTAVFSAHGVSLQIQQESEARQLNVFDATCPLVTKVHREVQKGARNNIECILIGHRGHVEVEGTLGNYISDKGRIYIVENIEQAQAISVQDPANLIWNTQTTLSVDDTKSIVEVLQRRFPAIKGPNSADICYATQNRQEAVKSILNEIDVLLVAGSHTSSNSTRLYELGRRKNIPSYLLQDTDRLREILLDHDVSTFGLTAGASTPESTVQDMLKTMQNIYPKLDVHNVVHTKEDTQFAYPKKIRALNLE